MGYQSYRLRQHDRIQVDWVSDGIVSFPQHGRCLQLQSCEPGCWYCLCINTKQFSDVGTVQGSFYTVSQGCSLGLDVLVSRRTRDVVSKRLGLVETWEGLGIDLVSDWKSNVSVSCLSRTIGSRLQTNMHSFLLHCKIVRTSFWILFTDSQVKTKMIDCVHPTERRKAAEHLTTCYPHALRLPSLLQYRSLCQHEGQHPLTGQHIANFRLVANQWAERRLVT